MLRSLTLLAFLLAATPSLAQVDYRPTPPPAVGAADRDWFRNGAAVPFAGDLYYPAGSTIYFDGGTMVPTGDYDGITLYADTTRAPYSMVLVPVTDGQLQPYVRRPSRETGAPAALRYYDDPQWESGRTGWQPAGREHVGATRDGRWAAPGQRGAEPSYPFEEQPAQFRMETVRKPEAASGIWIVFEGHRWQQVGEAVGLDPARLAVAGDYRGFPVYADSHEPYVIYLPTRASLVAPFRRIVR